MSYQRPSLTDLVNNIEADLNSRLEDASASSFPASDAAALSRVIAGGLHGLWGFLAYISQQIIPTTADDEIVKRHADWWGVPQKEAVASTGPLVVEGSVGAVISSGTVYQRADGAQFETTAEMTLSATTGIAPVVALIPGVDGNTLEGASFKLVSPIENISSKATVGVGGLTGGADIEKIDSLLSRLCERVQEPPMGGAKNDWVKWAREVPGVTRAWCFPMHVGAGTVGVAFVCDDQEGSIIPDEAKVAEVQAYLTDASRCPPACAVYAFAPTAKPLNLTISGLLPANEAVRTAIANNLRALLRDEAVPGATILITHIREAISAAVGEYDHVLVSPPENVTQAATEIATMGAFTWI